MRFNMKITNEGDGIAISEASGYANDEGWDL